VVKLRYRISENKKEPFRKVLFKVVNEMRLVFRILIFVLGLCSLSI
jgi:hypothetical protein